MEHNKSWIRNNLARLVRGLITKYTGYYLYPKFRVSRDFSFSDAYEKYDGKGKFINIGAGEYFYHPLWKNYDLYKKSLIRRIKHFNNYDLRSAEDNKFPEEGVDIIHCAHTLEHIPKDKIEKVLERMYQAMKRGGTLRVVVPDARLILEAYDKKDFDFFAPYKSWFTKRGETSPSIEDYLLQLVATPRCGVYSEDIRHEKKLSSNEIIEKRAILNDVDFLDFLVEGLKENNSSGTDHLNWFTSDKLIGLLKKAGFKDVHRSAFGQSRELVMRQIPLFDETLPYLSLYVEARK